MWATFNSEYSVILWLLLCSMEDVCTEQPKPTLPVQEIHSSKCITGLQVHKNGKNPSWNPLLFPPAIHHTVHCDKCPPGSCVPALRVPSEPTAAAVPTAPAPAAPDPLPQGQPLLSCSWEGAEGAAGWIPEHPPEAVPIPEGAGGCPGLPQGAPSSGGCTGCCFGASAPQP